MFAAIYVVDFPVAAAVRAEPSLREKAVAVLEGKPPLKKVVAANARARALGVAPGMTRLQMKEFGVPIELRRRSPEQEVMAHATLLDAACSFSPRVEETAADAVILDVAGLEALFGPPTKIANDLAHRALELGLAAHVAVAANPDAALYAARGFAGVTVIPADKTAERLGMLPIDILMSAAEEPETANGDQPVERFSEVMQRWGVRTFQSFAAHPSVAVVERLGQRGLLLQRLARGAVERTLIPFEPPLVFEETIELEYPVENLEPLAFLLNRMLEQLCARLAARSLATNEVRLACVLDPAEEFIRTLRLPVPMQDAKVLLKLLQLDLAAHPPPAPVAKIALRAEPVKPRLTQDGFFVPMSPEPEKLELLLARVAGIVGEGNVGAAEVLDSHRPDAYRIKKFGIVNCEFGGKGAKTHIRKSRFKPQNCSLALRLFRPPIRARVEVNTGKPIRVSFLDVARVQVIACAGPWRTSGEWWTDDGWRRDEWDVAVQTKDGAALYRMYRDLARGEWFVYGSYD